ncbi:H-type small acid-soluble spore protein [Paenibacillus sacheonensis]|uniref:H-type small acid-soluble spore protein n=1 Tax=Paenibacillus sacheonensis TaxID=742054 RepID=A0A7X4YPH5_9BACL|nr:H-type small acid-soluble spore protein [Paenibacillus sacheonensis]MBM7565069.1 small acid-soluble spore protein H (minor) [Paenibacillus sacheonensis]NBC70147.1 H-type small acid-soluble spore protein [Paenibacillus sacheonensis]
MNKLRAQEIAASPVMAEVTCDGVPVYIQYVDEENDTARIYPLDRPDEESTVSLGSLTEPSPFQSDGIHMICPPSQQQ